MTVGVCATAWTPNLAAETRFVGAGGDLQAALDAARPGDTILLEAGATFTGNYKLPAKGGSAYITIRSSAADSQLPGAGTRISPDYASRLPKLRSNQNGPALRAGAGATYWRLQFLEILPTGSTSSANLVEFGGTGTGQDSLSEVPHHLIIDRCYLHGDAAGGQRRGVALNSGEAEIVNSYFSDFKGVLQDTQAIAGWNGPGPFLIDNNYLEAAGENVMFGGSDPSVYGLVPTGITIRRNQISKPLAWMTQNWTVKNSLELKNAQDVLIEGNVIENNWAAGQQGYSIVLTPRNQSGTAPWSVVRNVTIQHNIVRHVAAGLNISGYDDLASSRQTEQITVRNNLFQDVSTRYAKSGAANGRLAVLGNGPRDITFDHNTVDNDGSSTIFLYAGQAPTGTEIRDFVLTNNLLKDNTYAVFADKFGEGNAAFAALAPNADVRRNSFANASARTYPTGNDFPTLAVWLADFLSAVTGDYRLTAWSLSNNAATDGTDMGVNFTKLNAAMNTATPPAPAPAPAPAPTTPPPAPAPAPPAPAPAPPSSGSSPYKGTAAALPGRVEFENYDAGGSGVAYSDTTSGNKGGVYRSNNVDLGVSEDSGGGYYLGWVKGGEWLHYTVEVAAARDYALDVRVASVGAGGTFHIEVNGTNVTGSMALPDTGGWQNWTTITRNVTLPAGRQALRVVMDANGAGGSVGSFNWLAVR